MGMDFTRRNEQMAATAVAAGQQISAKRQARRQEWEKNLAEREEKDLQERLRKSNRLYFCGILMAHHNTRPKTMV